VAGAATAVILVIGLLIVTFDSGARELLLNDRPEARVDAYLSAVRRGDVNAALRIWELDGRERSGLPERRTSVTTPKRGPLPIASLRLSGGRRAATRTGSMDQRTPVSRA